MYIRPDRDGFSVLVYVTELQRLFESTVLIALVGNVRSNMFTRQLAKDFQIHARSMPKRKDGSRVVARRAYGLVNARDRVLAQSVLTSDLRLPQSVHALYCLVVPDSRLTHKDGRFKDNWATNDTSLQQG